MPHHAHQGKKFENFIYNILNSRSKKITVVALVMLSLVGSVMMLPSKLVLARMLPGKSANTFSIYVNTPTGSSIAQTKKVTQCVQEILKKESGCLIVAGLLI